MRSLLIQEIFSEDKLLSHKPSASLNEWKILHKHLATVINNEPKQEEVHTASKKNVQAQTSIGIQRTMKFNLIILELVDFQSYATILK